LNAPNVYISQSQPPAIKILAHNRTFPSRLYSQSRLSIPIYSAWYRVHGLPIMDEAKQPEPIESEPKESTASRLKRREAEIALAMKQEAERRAAVVKNMHRLRVLRLSQTPKA
jgi:hypothetical protein